MGDCESMAPQLEGEENLIAAAKHIVRVLGSNKNLTKDMKKILADLGSQLSNMATMEDEVVVGVKSGIEEQLSVVEEKIMSWETDESMIFDSGPDEASEYLNATEEARKLIGELEDRCLNGEDEKELLCRAHDVLQLAMQRLEEEFMYLLVQHRQPFEPEQVSFRSSEDDSVDVGLMVSYGNDSFEESARRYSVSRSEDCIVDLVHPDVIHDLKCIANSMFLSNYDNECCQVYVAVRKDALDKCLSDLEIDKLSIDDVLKMEWGTLNSKIKRWIRAMKVFVRPYLASEKWLCDQIFLELGSASSVCFVGAAKAPMLQLLNFAEAVSIGSHQPEKLVRFLDMYEVLADLLPDIDALFLDETGSSVGIEYHEVLERLADSVMATFLEFKNAVASNTSMNPFAGGGNHPLTRYVMNYIKILVDYKDTLNLLLKNDNGEAATSLSPDMSPAKEGESTGNDSCGGVSAMALHLQSLTSILEANLHEKSRLYRDASLQHLFLMNNIHYMAQKVKNSELQGIFGDKWIRKHNRKFQQHAMDYERATWSSILSLLKDESNSSNSSISRTLLKERLRSFYIAFEDVYKTQTAWIIPDLQLREDLRISTSLKVIQAYRTFVGRQMHQIGEKHIRYNAEDLQDYLLDLFEGSQKSLHNPHRR
ncbi:serine carboxypeptidase-like 25-like isoform X1 [Hibiscus syriacus]|uniref:Exocyst subunit Exo70 family protein n=1 Tax=Hibiscus syriacus TaxID=106335 RepID=A0A6A2YI12_HIBSY|nr:exocyst complex component EXO70E2-like [Hibiscus syriacus]KAE8675797.1 serine carboxypeptidase-like 25-like isoform X1 [Hibiscus syriacus]